MIRLVTFDLDDTLWSVGGVIREAVSRTNAWLVEQAPAYIPYADLPEARQREIDVCVRADPRIDYDVSLWRKLLIREELCACGYSAEQAEQLAVEALEEFLDWRHRVQFFDGALTVLAELSSNYQLAALTNGNADYRRLNDLARLLSFGYCAADVRAKKPHTAMFKCALARAGVAAEEAVHVGDHPIDDMQGATNAGMKTIWANLQQCSKAVPATATVTKLEQLPAVIASL